MAVLSLLTSYLASSESLHNECVEEVDFLEDGIVPHEPQLRPDFHSLLGRHYEEVKTLPQFDRLKNFVAKGELANEFLIDFNGTPIQPENYDRWLCSSICLPLLSRYLTETHSLEFNKETFDKLYEGIEYYCYNPTVRLIHVAPLFHFDMEDCEEVISLAPNLVIRRLTAQERSDLWHRVLDIPSLSRQDIYYLRFAVEATSETNRHSPIYDSRESFINLESLLRLIIRQPIAINFVLQHQEPWFNSSAIIGSLYAWSTTRLQRLIPSYTPIAFTAQHARVLQRLWSGCVAIGNKTQFALALHRFSSSYDEARIEDKLLDLWLGLEALFSEAVDRELTYRISLRVAYFLSKNYKKRKEIKEDILRSYKCRGKIVHGKQSKGDLKVITQLTERYLASSIRLCLISGHVPSGKELEERIIKGE